jgi:hypothetical protein
VKEEGGANSGVFLGSHAGAGMFLRVVKGGCEEGWKVLVRVSWR